MGNNMVYAERTEFYKVMVHNKGKNPEVHYDVFGSAVIIPPGGKSLVTRARIQRPEDEPIVFAKEPEEQEDGDKPSDGAVPRATRGRKPKNG